MIFFHRKNKLKVIGFEDLRGGYFLFFVPYHDKKNVAVSNIEALSE